MRYKRCPTCGATKPDGEFGKNKATTDGLCAYCKACQAARAKAWRESHPDAQKAIKARYAARLAEPATKLDQVAAADGVVSAVGTGWPVRQGGGRRDH